MYYDAFSTNKKPVVGAISGTGNAQVSDFAPLGEFMISPFHYIIYTHYQICQSWDYVYGLMTLVYLPRLAGLLCLDYVYGLMTLVCLPRLAGLLCLDYVYRLMTLVCLPRLA